MNFVLFKTLCKQLNLAHCNSDTNYTQLPTGCNYQPQIRFSVALIESYSILTKEAQFHVTHTTFLCKCAISDDPAQSTMN